MRFGLLAPKVPTTPQLLLKILVGTFDRLIKYFSDYEIGIIVLPELSINKILNSLVLGFVKIK